MHPEREWEVAEDLQFDHADETINHTAKYRLRVPPQFPWTRDAFDLSTVQVRREGGPTPADLEFREELFAVVGSITVAGGQIEAALKRLLLILRGNAIGFGSVDLQWAQLEKKVRAASQGDRRAEAIGEMLDWSERKKIRSRRHTVVHGAWWLYDGERARVGRWPQGKNSFDHTLLTTLADLNSLAERCWEYVSRIETLIGDDWPTATLPAPKAPEAFQRDPHTDD